MSVSGGVLLNSFQNIERKRKAFEELSMTAKWRSHQKRRSFFPLAKMPAPFIKIQGAMWP
jgi:hypothetical protein